MAEKNRASLLAIVVETTAGTLKAPTAGSDFIALQEGFSVVPNFNSIDNQEIRSSIGNAKSILGLESPTSSFDHYLRHSGTEGTAPGYGNLIKATLGATTTNSTARTLTSGSTTAVINLAAGGSDFSRGFAILLKDATNNYQVRPVDSISTNALTLAFQVAVAPLTGITTGKCINYSPANTGHPSLSLWFYRGNGGAVEAMAGSRIESMSISIAAGELVNASYSAQGTKYFFNPIEITASNKYLDFTDDDGTAEAAVAIGYYRDPYELAAAITAAMNAANAGETHTCTYIDSSGKFKILSTGTVLSLLWKTGTHGSDNTDTHIGTTIGFSDAANNSGTAAATGYTGASALSFAAGYTPSYDSADPQAAKYNEVLIGDVDDITCFCAKTVDITITNEIADDTCVCAESGVQDKIFNKRTIEVTIKATMTRYDVDKFYKFRSNANSKFLYNFGSRTGGNWVAGTVCSIYIPTATISSYELGDDNGIVTIQLTVRAYVDSSGNGEFYINFL